MHRMLIQLVGCVLALNADYSVAEEAVHPASAYSPAVIEQLAMANKLIALGDARKDPLLLIVAAKIQKSLDADVGNTQAHSTMIEDVLDRAKKYAGIRKDLVNIADDIAAMRSKSYRSDCAGFQRGPCNEAVLY